MAFSTPWAVGGGASHQVEIARQQTHDSTGGAEGISLPGDLKVEPLQTPGTKVRVAPGGALLLNRYPGGAGQTYAVRNDAEVEVSVTATGSSGKRSDLVVARVLDPQYEGQPPNDTDDFDYSMVEIVEDVSSSATSVEDVGLNYPEVALARIDLPKNTGTVEADHLTDLREMARPRSKRFLFTYGIKQSDPVPEDWLNWPTAAPPDGEAWPNHFWHVDIPSWAQRVRIRGFWAQVKVDQKTPNNYGHLWVRVGTLADGFSSQHVNWDISTEGGITRQTWMVA